MYIPLSLYTHISSVLSSNLCCFAVLLRFLLQLGAEQHFTLAVNFVTIGEIRLPVVLSTNH